MAEDPRHRDADEVTFPRQTLAPARKLTPFFTVSTVFGRSFGQNDAMSNASENGDHRRDPRGRFAAGNAGGPGRPKKAAEPRELNPHLAVEPIQLLLLADMLEHRAKVMIDLEKRYSPEIVARLHQLIALTDHLAGVDDLD